MAIFKEVNYMSRLHDQLDFSPKCFCKQANLHLSVPFATGKSTAEGRFLSWPIKDYKVRELWSFQAWVISGHQEATTGGMRESVAEPNSRPLARHAAKPIYGHHVLWWKRVQHLFTGHQARRTGSSCSKHLNSLMAFREGFLKSTLGVRIMGCVISSWTFFWLVGGEIKWWCSRNLNHQPPGSNQSGACMLVVSM